ncbi:MAG: hypothetical protein K2Z80_37145 [Xanthobacteraceae bacterium]|nr:hypothetical protein [Xanthobacteraceae bacterium]
MVSVRGRFGIELPAGVIPTWRSQERCWYFALNDKAGTAVPASSSMVMVAVMVLFMAATVYRRRLEIGLGSAQESGERAFTLSRRPPLTYAAASSGARIS